MYDVRDDGVMCISGMKEALAKIGKRTTPKCLFKRTNANSFEGNLLFLPYCSFSGLVYFGLLVELSYMTLTNNLYK